MSGYQFLEIERKWQRRWAESQVFKSDEQSGKPSFYVLDMFPYPSGSGLHVGHPLGYIASDIYARYKRHKGFEVLHPMGYDAFGLPAEQYAIEKGKHPSETTEENIKRYREQLDAIGLSFDWSREFRTSQADYYKWTQWIFLKMFDCWYDQDSNKARLITELIEIFNENGNEKINAACGKQSYFSASDWQSFSEEEKARILLQYRLAYLDYADVNWCPALGTVLANDEVKEGYSERGGHPVYKKRMRQWFLRVTAYAERLLEGLDKLDWPDSLKEIQKNWIGKSNGAEINFKSEDSDEVSIKVFTTRPDTIFGATFMVLAPEHKLVEHFVSGQQTDEVNAYIEAASRKTERERMADAANITGVFTGGYVLHPFTNKKIPVWLADYVLADYGTGAIMAVPAHDQRDYAFAKHFQLPIVEVVESDKKGNESHDLKEGRIKNSDFMNGLEVAEAIQKAILEIEKKGIGSKKVNYKLRDAGFSRQRYWGEPFPIVYNNDIPCPLPEEELPVELPRVKSFKPLKDGSSPLASVNDWVKHGSGLLRETNTMPGYAGSSWYFLRYMDSANPDAFVSPEKEKYWKQVDLYVGGAEHATGHLIYSRFYQKFLFDRTFVSSDEPFAKLINQGMILYKSAFVYRIKGENMFVSKGLINQYDVTPLHVDISLVNDADELDTEAFRKYRKDYSDAEFVLEKGKYICGRELEKMSKSKLNVVNPDDVINAYGADTFRMYEMFLGPVDISKPWDTKGIDGVSKFIRKFWRLYHDENNNFKMTDEAPSDESLRTLHQAIKKINIDIERFSFNTCISALMICVNELSALKCKSKEVLKPLIVLISPFAPHLAEELWEKAGYTEGISHEVYPVHEESYLKVDQFEYPVSINGKLRAKQSYSVDKSPAEIQQEVLSLPEVDKWIAGKDVKKIIVVPNRIINIVVG